MKGAEEQDGAAPLDLEAIRARLEAAVERDATWVLLGEPTQVWCQVDTQADPWWICDAAPAEAAFIASAPGDVRALLAEVERLRAAVLRASYQAETPQDSRLYNSLLP